MNFIELIRMILAAIGLQLEDNNTIVKIKRYVKTIVTCNNKLFIVNNAQIPVDNKSILLNLTRSQQNCSSHMIKKHIESTLSSKLDVLISYLIKFVSNSDFHNENGQELNQLVFNLQKVNNSSADNILPQKTLDKFSKILNIIRNQASQDIFIKIDTKIEDVKIDDKEAVSSYNKIHNSKNEKVAYVHRDLLATVIFPLYDLLKRSTNNKLFGVSLEEKEIEMFKLLYQFIFKDIDINNTYRFPNKILWKDKKHDVNKIFLIDHILPARPLLLLKTFIKIADRIDFLLDKLSVMDESIKHDMFNLAITEEILDKFEKDNITSLDFDNSSNLINELKHNKPADIESLNKALNDKNLQASKISVVENQTETKSLKVSSKKRQKRGRSFLSMQSSFMSLPSFSIGSSVLDPSADTFDTILPPDEILKHIHILSGTGGGKTELMKNLSLSNIQKGESSVVVFDIHGDYALELAKQIEDKERLILIDPFLEKGKIPTIDPLKIKIKDEETIAIMTQELLSAFEIGLGIKWSINMEAVFVPCLSTILRAGNLGIFDLQRLMDSNNNFDLVELGKKSPIKGHRDFFNYQFNMEKLEVTRDAIATKLQVLLNDPIFANLISGENTIDLEKEINTEGKVIIFKLAKGKMKNTLSLYTRLMMATIQGIVLKRAELSPSERPHTFLYLDEFQNYIGLTIEEILSESRKYGLSVTLAHQTIAQIDNKLRGIVLSNTNIKIVGKNSYEDLRVMGKEIQTDVKVLENLNVGEFFLKVGSKEAFKIMNTDKFIGNKGAIDDSKWQEHLEYQIKHYYRDVADESLQQTMSNAEFKQTLEAEVVQSRSPLIPYIDEF